MSQRIVISTRTENESRGRMYNIDTNGFIQDQKKVNLLVGTFVSVFQLFHCFPVRRQDALKCTIASNKSICEIIKRYSSIRKKVLTLQDSQLFCHQFDSHSNHIAKTVLILPLINHRPQVIWFILMFRINFLMNRIQ